MANPRKNLTEHPLCVPGGAVQAIRTGIKTVLRIPVDPQPEDITDDVFGIEAHKRHLKNSPYKPGHVFWLKERYALRDKKPIFRYDFRYGKAQTIAWRPASQMPRKHARQFARITDVQLQRLWDISGDDLIAEGLFLFRYHYIAYWNEMYEDAGFPWRTNAWVWRITVENLADYKPEIIPNKKKGRENQK